MKKNLYYRYILKRENLVMNWILSIFSSYASYARMIMEVFLRKDFGERYFQLPTVILIACFLVVHPIISYSHPIVFADSKGGAIAWFIYQHIGWYVFLFYFVKVSIKHYKSLQKSRSAFDFSRFSMSSGTVNPVFFKVKLKGLKTDIRLIECLLEPGVFFIAGLLLAVIGQKLGLLFLVCSVIYALSYVAAYTAGDYFVLDRIDETICNEELEKAFLDDMLGEQTRGFRFRWQRPESRDMREKIYPLILDDEEIFTAR